MIIQYLICYGSTCNVFRFCYGTRVDTKCQNLDCITIQYNWIVIHIVLYHTTIQFNCNTIANIVVAIVYYITIQGCIWYFTVIQYHNMWYAYTVLNRDQWHVFLRFYHGTNFSTVFWSCTVVLFELVLYVQYHTTKQTHSKYCIFIDISYKYTTEKKRKIILKFELLHAGTPPAPSTSSLSHHGQGQERPCRQERRWRWRQRSFVQQQHAKQESQGSTWDFTRRRLHRQRNGDCQWRGADRGWQTGM